MVVVIFSQDQLTIGALGIFSCKWSLYLFSFAIFKCHCDFYVLHILRVCELCNPKTASLRKSQESGSVHVRRVDRPPRAYNISLYTLERINKADSQRETDWCYKMNYNLRNLHGMQISEFWLLVDLANTP